MVLVLAYLVTRLIPDRPLKWVDHWIHGAGDRLQGSATQQRHCHRTRIREVSAGLPAFPRSRFVQPNQLSVQQIATNRMLQFGNKEQP